MLRLQKIEDLYIFGVWKPVKDANNAAATILKEFCKQASKHILILFYHVHAIKKKLTISWN